MRPIAFETAFAALEPDQRAFCHRSGATRVFGDSGADRFAVPILGVLDVENRVEREIAAFLAAEADALERRGGAGGAAGRLRGAMR